MQDLSGTMLGPYELRDILGKGGMATVYRAFQPGMEREVAIKVMSPDLAEQPEFIARFEREARIIAQLQHPHILPVYDFGRSGQYTYLVTRLIERGTLGNELRGKPLPPARVVKITRQIADALDYAHRRGIVHRDLKPTNVLLDNDDHVFLTDFGIAKLIVGSTISGLTAPNAVMGTPTYMAPEQWRSEPVDARTDVYALGVMVYQMLLGQVPFSAETPHGLMYQHLDKEPTPARQINPALPPAIEPVLRRALAKQRAARYASAGEFARDLDRALGFPERLPEQTLLEGADDLTIDAGLGEEYAPEDLLVPDDAPVELTDRASRSPFPPPPPPALTVPVSPPAPYMVAPSRSAMPELMPRPSSPIVSGYAPPYRPLVERPHRPASAGRMLVVAAIVVGVLIVVAAVVVISALLLNTGDEAAGPRPMVTITAPADGAIVQLGMLVAIQFTATSEEGISRIELQRFGQVLNTIEGSGEKTFQGWFTYAASNTGTHELSVIAYSGARASEPATVTILVQ